MREKGYQKVHLRIDLFARYNIATQHIAPGPVFLYTVEALIIFSERIFSQNIYSYTLFKNNHVGPGERSYGIYGCFSDFL